MASAAGPAPDEIERILDGRRESARRSRQRSLGIGLAIVAALSFLLVPAMRAPLTAWQWQQQGIPGQAVVNGRPGDAVEPAVCSADGVCWEYPVVVVDLTGGPAPTREELARTVGQPLPPGRSYLIGVVAHRVASADAATPVGGTFPVWILPGSASVTSEEPASPLLLALARWWWLLLAVLAVACYGPIEAAFSRWRGSRRPDGPPA